MSEQEKEKTAKKKAVELLRKGYTRRQLVNDLGFAERTADRAVKELRDSGEEIVEDNVAKVEDKATVETLPAKAKSGEVIIPEWIANEMVNIFDGNERDQRIYLAGLATPILGVRLIQEMVKPLTDMMLAIRKEELQAVMETQAMSREIAERAAQGVGAQVVQAVKQQAPAATNPMEQLMADMMRQPLTQMMSKVMGASMGQASAQPQAGPNVPGQNQMTNEEVKEVFND
ncbi:MAG: hypothetical protein FJZ94_08745 [Chloroflexi bacterium]|nr:hypothetical protein [Chloroflexota bacterium]MBM4452924.1 hypothetical protein [Chloroflexota bacterium]MBM4454657.1 hypothetical protein [Chloroflexota bacterium]